MLHRKYAELRVICLYYKWVAHKKAMAFVKWQHDRVARWKMESDQEMWDTCFTEHHSSETGYWDEIKERNADAPVELLHPLVRLFGNGGCWILESIAALRKGLVVKQAQWKQRQLDREMAQHPEGWGCHEPGGWEAQERNGQWKCVRIKLKTEEELWR